MFPWLSQPRKQGTCAKTRLATAGHRHAIPWGGRKELKGEDTVCVCVRTLPAGVEEADEGGRGGVGDAADPDDGPAGLAALPVLLEAALQDAAEHRRRRGLARAETRTNTTLIRRATQDRLRANRGMRQGPR